LALLQVASRQGIWLPLILDEPFERLDARTAASLATVLDSFCQQGHQVLVFTTQRSAVERLISHGAAIHDILSLRGKQPASTLGAPTGRPTNAPTMGAKRRPAKRRKSVERSTKIRPARPAAGEPPANERNEKSDAA
jgi:ABC-type nitrate/sulfonate/bicarbonate transport system ATPase subunit